MAFEGYKFKFNLIAAHRFYDEKEELSLHTYTLELTLYIKRPEEIFIPYGDIEKIVNYILLSNYSEKVLNEIPPFDKIQPNIENMGQVFQQRIKAELASKGFILTSFEISETPLRTYIVNEACLEKSDNFYNRDHMTSYLLMKNIKAISNQQILSSISKHSKPAKSNSHLQVPQDEQEIREIKNYKRKKILRAEPERINYKNVHIKLAFAVLFLFIFGLIMTTYIKNTGSYPSGADVFGHIFKADLLYKDIKNGDIYPLYTNLWYNGVQPFRYWAPFPYYTLAFFQFITNGDAISAYLIFVFSVFFIGGCGWLLWGWQQNRVLICTLTGTIWFFMPDNIRVFFSEGNIPRVVITAILPYLFFFIWQFIEYNHKRALVSIVICMCLITGSHAMIAAMTGIASFIFLIIYCIIEKRILQPFYVIIAMLFSFIICGIWLYPALHGGLLGMDASATSDVMKALTYPIVQTLNPLLRLTGHIDLFYYGISICIISIIGIFIAGRKSMPGFVTAIIVLLSTTTSAVPFLIKLPLNQLLWAMRFTPIVYALFLVSLLQWKKCRRYIMLIIILILVIDILPSVDIKQYYYNRSEKVKEFIIDAKEITNQRMALIDLSAFGSYPSYEICAVDSNVQYTFGWAWQGAENSPNIVRLNTAMEKGYFEYLFDRCLELGNDTVIVRKELVKKSKKNSSMLINAALDSGYNLYEETNYTYIFHKNTPSTFGVHTKYTGIAIGLSADSIALAYPCFEEGTYTNIEDYSFEELSKYKSIYLSGFFYRNRTAAEQLITKLAATGVKVIIDMNRIPIDPLTNRMTFLNVTAQTVTFTDRYPELMYKDEIYKGKRFKNEYSTWNTVYLENVKKSIGYSWFQNKNLDFIGTSENDNIVFMGFNILFHVMETDDKTILGLINDILGIKAGQLPVREVVPIKIQYGKDKIIIDAPRSDVNTTIAYQDNFKSEGKIIDFNNLLKVSNLHTEINIEYPYLIQGTIISVFGVLGTWKLFHFIFKRKGRLK